MKVGDLVRNLNSESGMPGLVVEFTVQKARHLNDDEVWATVPIVLWADGRCNWIVRRFTEVIDESR